MLNSKNLSSILSNIDKSDVDFQTIMENYIKFRIRIAQKTEEIRNEIMDFDDDYQFFIKNKDGRDFNFWLRFSKGKVSYHKGIKGKTSLQLIMSKEMVKKFLSRELTFAEAYMKGLIVVKGSLTEAIKYRSLIRIFHDHVFEILRQKK